MKCEISRGTAQNGNEILGDCTECRKLIFNISTQERPYIIKYWLVMKYRLLLQSLLKCKKNYKYLTGLKIIPKTRQTLEKLMFQIEDSAS